MPDRSGELEGLYAQHQLLADRLNRFLVLRILLLGLLAIALARSLGVLNSQAVRHLRAQIQETQGIVAVPDRLVWPFATPFAPDANPRLAYNAASPEELALAAEVVERAFTATAELQEHYRAFTISFSVLGTDFTVHLGRWLLWIPVLFIASAVYVSLLRSKQRAIRAYARRLMEDPHASREGVPDSFHGWVLSGTARDGTRFADHPGRFFGLADTLVALGFLAYLVFATIRNDLWSDEARVSIPILLALPAYYAWLYCLRSRRGILAELADPRPGGSEWLVTRWHAALRRVGARCARLRPGWALPAGSVLVLSSLVLPTFPGGCVSTATGLELLGRVEVESDANWFTSDESAENGWVTADDWVEAKGLHTLSLDEARDRLRDPQFDDRFELEFELELETSTWARALGAESRARLLAQLPVEVAAWVADEDEPGEAYAPRYGLGFGAWTARMRSRFGSQVLEVLTALVYVTTLLLVVPGLLFGLRALRGLRPPDQGAGFVAVVSVVLILFLLTDTSFSLLYSAHPESSDLFGLQLLSWGVAVMLFIQWSRTRPGKPADALASQLSGLVAVLLPLYALTLVTLGVAFAYLSPPLLGFLGWFVGVHLLALGAWRRAHASAGAGTAPAQTDGAGRPSAAASVP